MSTPKPEAGPPWGYESWFDVLADLHWARTPELIERARAELTALRAELAEVKGERNAACLWCIWNNDDDATLKPVVEGCMSHCEDGSADQYDAYPLADYQCSGFTHHQAHARTLEAQLEEKERELNAQAEMIENNYQRAEEAEAQLDLHVGGGEWERNLRTAMKEYRTRVAELEGALEKADALADAGEALIASVDQKRRWGGEGQMVERQTLRAAVTAYRAALSPQPSSREGGQP